MILVVLFKDGSWESSGSECSSEHDHNLLIHTSYTEVSKVEFLVEDVLTLHTLALHSQHLGFGLNFEISLFKDHSVRELTCVISFGSLNTGNCNHNINTLEIEENFLPQGHNMLSVFLNDGFSKFLLANIEFLFESRSLNSQIQIGG